jgi:uncharacterized membrane protein YhaH (DUF805 family)
MNFQEAIASALRNYTNFSGRAVRSEFWYWQLFLLIGGLVAELLDVAIRSRLSVVTTLFWLATLVPGIAVAVRRLHDTDRTGWWLLLFPVPMAGQIVLVIWWCIKGTKGYNRFGADRMPGEPRPRHRVREATQ